jgi:hypothetical protein
MVLLLGLIKIVLMLFCFFGGPVFLLMVLTRVIKDDYGFDSEQRKSDMSNLPFALIATVVTILLVATPWWGT